MNYIETEHYRRVTKRSAKMLYDKGSNIHLVPCKLNPESDWTSIISINKICGKSFEELVRAFEYYNCSNLVGTYCAYYLAN